MRRLPVARLPDRAVGLALVLTSATGFGAMPVLVKFAYADGAEPVAVLAGRFAIGAGLLAVVAAISGAPWPRGRVAAGLLALGGIGYLTQSASYFLALRTAPAGLVAILFYLYPSLVVLLAAVVLRQRPGAVRLTALVAALVGSALTVGPVASGQGLGIALALASAVAYAVYIVVGSRLLTVVAPLPATAVIMSGTTIGYGVLALVARPAMPASGVGWAAILGLGVVGTALAVGTFFAGLARLGPADAAVASTLEPVVSVALAAVVLGERLTPVQAIGAAFVLGAVVVLARGNNPRPGDVREATGSEGGDEASGSAGGRSCQNGTSACLPVVCVHGPAPGCVGRSTATSEPSVER